ncbi:BQ5605_C027g10419 [Microbotryum silenes-dioicae]|uniref:BQ5605_C027g10419 protein n=1 Tax=Microbotryum silenes-dioicae TaxID=796604 RepID=A0A2X0PGU5_9BASI|nr:BQ5605_C027g10419 [Microbotryum silenes-dioicae]
MASTSTTTAPAQEDQVACIPNLKLAQHAFLLSRAITSTSSSSLSSPSSSTTDLEATRKALLQAIEEDGQSIFSSSSTRFGVDDSCARTEMAPWLAALTTSPQTSSSTSSTASTSFNSAILPPQPDLLARLQRRNKDHLATLDAQLADAETNLGETEISDALKAKALYLARIGEKDLAVKAHLHALDKTAGKGSKIDLRLAIIRIGFFHGDHNLIQDNIEKTRILVEEGGDWDRRNRLKAYEGLYLLSIRNFKKGGQLLLDTLSTFTATELIDYDDFVALCVLSGALMLERKDLKKKVGAIVLFHHCLDTDRLILQPPQIIEAPEVIALIPTRPTLKDYCESLWRCDYAAFFKALAIVEESHLLPARLLSVHSRYYVREMRIKAYAQLLESYRSVTLASLSNAFGVSQDFIDADLARFISAGRLNCSIDRVNSVVETNRPDAKNARYASVIKKGDLVLNSVQRLSRVIG